MAKDRGEVLFEARNVCVDLRRDGSVHRVVSDASFELAAGEVYDLKGASGSGKSSLLRACARMVGCAQGDLLLEGKPAAHFAPEAWRAAVCLVPQKPSLVAGSVRDNLLLPWTLAVRKGEPRPSDATLRELLDAAGLGDIALDRDVSQLSGGQVARVALCRAMLAKPQVVLMDEVDAALDAESSAAVSALTQRFAAAGGTCLRIRHRASDGLASATFSMESGVLTRRDAAACGAVACGAAGAEALMAPAVGVASATAAAAVSTLMPASAPPLASAPAQGSHVKEVGHE